MVVVIAPDSFKECMTANEACDCIERAIRKIMPQAVCIKSPIADGGEGSMQIIANAAGGDIFTQEVKDPLGSNILASYAILAGRKTAVVEMAAASGLQLVPTEKRNPLITTSYGTGELIKAALQHRVEKILITIGGSATNDGGVGMLQALGFAFLNKAGNEIGFGGGSLCEIETIDGSYSIMKQYPNVQIEVACDVNNPLIGLNGATVIYGPQKGASAQMIQQLEENMLHYANKIKQFTGMDMRNVPGAGAAGGVGAALMAFLHAKLVSGIELIMEYIGIEEKIAKADLVMTGEGSIDKQTIQGKAIQGIAALAKKYNKPTVAFVGKIADNDALGNLDTLEAISITPSNTPLAEALKKGKENLEKAVIERFKV